jgi:Pectate lyase superfamily protein
MSAWPIPSRFALPLTICLAACLAACGDDNDTAPHPDGAVVDPSNIIPAHRRLDWQPGVVGGIPTVAEACPVSAPTVLDFGAVADGVTDDAPAFQDAIDAAPESSSVRIPAGDYLLASGLTIDHGVVLCGAGSDQSRLLFDTESTAISMVTYDRGDWVALESGYSHGSTTLTVADPASFAPGDYAELQQDNNWARMDPEGVWRNASWVPEAAMGQMVQIINVEGNTLTVAPPVTVDYDPSYHPQIRPLGLVSGAGLQSLYLTRLNASDHGTIELKNAVGCWVRDCESEMTYRAHVSTNAALWCEIRDSWFHHAHDHGGGGHGYGVNLGNHTTACLVENNVFVDLRHSMLVQSGATANVFGYNYSRENYQSEGGDWTPCDISLHGHYPSMNLFEGNVIQEIDVSDYWGPCGPGNTFFRNRVESEGIQIMDYSHDQNIVANELTASPNIVDVDDTCAGALIHANLEDGVVGFHPDISDHSLPDSLYLATPPAFFSTTAVPWPTTGSDVASQANPLPAQQRWLDTQP